MNIEATSPALLTPLFADVENMVYAQKASDLTVQTTDVHTACKLNAEWHSRFPVIKWGNVVRNKRYVCFIAQYEGLTYAVALWSSPIAANRMKNAETLIELRRMAIAQYAPKNTATFMLKKMRLWIRDNFPEITTAISYQDTEAHHGTIYRADNWQPTTTSKFVKWDGKRQRNQDQSTAAKIRWERKIR